MNAPTAVLLAWILFAGTHLAFGLLPLRDRLSWRMGEQAFVAMFSGVSALCIGVLALAVGRYGAEGPAGPALGADPFVRGTLIAISFLGLTLATAGLLNYMRSPMALFRKTVRPPAGVERITRHAFFTGLTLFALAHALLAPTMAVAIYFGGFAALSVVGVIVQDRKLLRKYGAAYGEYLAVTSTVPLVAMLQGRQRITAEDGLPRTFGISAAIALVLLAAHPIWSLYHGALFSALIAAGGAFASARRAMHAKGAANGKRPVTPA